MLRVLLPTFEPGPRDLDSAADLVRRDDVTRGIKSYIGPKLANSFGPI
jgi:hypothetical protein